MKSLCSEAAQRRKGAQSDGVACIHNTKNKTDEGQTTLRIELIGGCKRGSSFLQRLVTGSGRNTI
jgi:hypothetical protein